MPQIPPNPTSYKIFLLPALFRPNDSTRFTHKPSCGFNMGLEGRHHITNIMWIFIKLTLILTDAAHTEPCKHIHITFLHISHITTTDVKVFFGDFMRPRDCVILSRKGKLKCFLILFLCFPPLKIWKKPVMCICILLLKNNALQNHN